MAPKFHHIIQIIPHPDEPNSVLGLDKDGDIHVGKQEFDNGERRFVWEHVPSHWREKPERR